MEDNNSDSTSFSFDNPGFFPLKISAIILAYNEATRIGNVLDILSQVPCLLSIIVVDDGSTEDTYQVFENYIEKDHHISLVRHPKNRGKEAAIYTTLKNCPSDTIYVLMLDADLRCLKFEHVIELINPVLSSAVNMTRRLFVGGMWNTDFSHWLTPWLSGQFCLRKHFFESLDWNATRGYGLETVITLTAKSMGYQIQDAQLTGVSHPPSEFHYGLLKGTLNHIRMYSQIFSA